jgi:hypothetical protein
LISKNETTWSSFDAIVRRVTAETMQKGEQPSRRDLEKAYKQWTEDLGITNSIWEDISGKKLVDYEVCPEAKGTRNKRSSNLIKAFILSSPNSL